ncbi:DUF2478 domain-containing protein [Rhodobacteraceae bacterium B1Z28]|uniref:DUF2478 domain-containing protein n=1 Tax=Ruegeria haliotis TaxID=2747601 RepID=A0ABX2PYB5_9RHOB|nr:DUF2478 domain-containing protein [Ruegeria haliotis]NVO58052.1 DUF2478 domain-containing protein [Ruegeria haliotis]
MKLAYVTSQKQGETDRLLSDLAADLQSSGLKLCGIVKEVDYSPTYQNGCDMSVRVLPDGPVIKITQNLGKGSDACRLDPAALTDAVAQVERRGFEDIDLFILNKFGPEECGGRGFCSVLGKALEHDVPVLVGAGTAGVEAFQAFSGGLAKGLPDNVTALRDWCVASRREAKD